MLPKEAEKKINVIDQRVRCISRDLCWLTDDIKNALINSPNLSGDNFVVNLEVLANAIDSVGVGTNIFVVDYYSNLPAANLHPGVFYWVEADEGTWWLPGTLGGTYFKKGLYYSNGIVWETAPVPYQATQAEVDAGVNEYKFVTPKTLKTRLDTFTSDLNYLHEQVIPSATWTITHNLGKFPSINVMDTAGTEIEGAVEYTNTNTLIVSFNNAFSGKATLN